MATSGLAPISGQRELLRSWCLCGIPLPIRCAHLYFESIHPFEDGNGRMGRVLVEKALAQTTGFPNLTSLSITIERNKKEYCAQLERAQRSLEITPWVHYPGFPCNFLNEWGRGQINFVPVHREWMVPAFAQSCLPFHKSLSMTAHHGLQRPEKVVQ